MDRAKLRRTAGFTLVELMVVVVILGLLATVGTVAYRKFLGDASEKTATAKCKELEDLIDNWVTLNQGVEIPNADEFWTKLVEEGLIKDRRVPKDPWGEVYQITHTEDDQYRVWSKGKDKQPENDDDVFTTGLRASQDDY